MPGLENTDMNTAFHIVCAWCEGLMRASPDPDARVSHSICETCFEREFAAIRARRSRSVRPAEGRAATPAGPEGAPPR